MVNNLTTVDVVIAKIVSAFDIQESINEDEWIEWIMDANRFIGSAQQLVDKPCVIQVTNYKGKFPCGFYQLINIDDYLTPNCIYQDYNYQELYGVFFSNAHSYQSLLEKYNNLQFDNSIFDYHVFDSSYDTYRIKHNTIQTNFSSGILKAHYKSYPVDEETGYILLPDDEGFQTACMWYVGKFLTLRKQLKEFTFKECDQYWLKYCLQARGNMNLPDNPTQNEVANRFNSLPQYGYGRTNF